MRTNKHELFLDLAERCARQGTCLRRNYGVVIVDIDNTVVSTGYTGAPTGMKDCLESRNCWRENNNIQSGTQYEKCKSVHAEQNALIQAGKKSRSSVLYLSGIDGKTGNVVDSMPCFLCAKMILNAGISKVIIRMSNGSKTELKPSDIYDKRFVEAFGEIK